MHNANEKHMKKAGSISTRRSFLLGAVAVLSSFSAGTGLADSGFNRWISTFKKTALANGVTAATFDHAFKGIKAPDPDVLEKAAKQPEFSETAWSYFDNRVNEDTITRGRTEAKRWARWLSVIERNFGVPPSILLAIWSMETNYGEAMKRVDIMKDTIRSLATLAYASPRRAKYARTQLIMALKILQQGDIDRRHFSGSWAGAMGHTQFIPTSYMRYAVDIDGDNRRDIWNSVPDALASTANLLQKNGWQRGRTWGYEVVLPHQKNKFPGGFQTLSQWEKMGLKRTNGKAFPYPSTTATLKLPQGRGGPVFLVTKNFFVLKRYNNADRYALAVGLLADQIAGYGGLKQDWNRPFTPVSMSERREIQSRLSVLGYYNGKVDGKIGAESTGAIEAFQSRNGLGITGHPSRELLSILRSR